MKYSTQRYQNNINWQYLSLEDKLCKPMLIFALKQIWFEIAGNFNICFKWQLEFKKLLLYPKLGIFTQVLNIENEYKKGTPIIFKMSTQYTKKQSIRYKFYLGNAPNKHCLHIYRKTHCKPCPHNRQSPCKHLTAEY